jgi:ferredoxin-type protein NapH
MSQFTESLMQLLGREPTRPAKDSISPAVVEVMLEKRRVGLKKADLIAVEEAHALKPKQWRRRRWLTLVLVNVLFLVSYKLDIQLLEGALTASRFVGFHMADLNSALQVMLAYKHVVLNLMIGTATVLIMWILLGGRTFCAWVCPYHLLSEWAEKIHLWLVAKKVIKNRTFDRRVRTVFYVIFILLALLTGYTVFETLSPTGILSRALIYGPGIALLWVLALLMFEVLVSRRAWCRYVCPIGMTYGFVGLVSPVQVKYNIKNCHHEGDCRAVCLVPHVLSMTIKGRSPEETMNIGADCTRCGMCVDICPPDSLNFDIKGLNKIL